MPKKRSKKLNAIQLEFQRLSSNTARTKKLQELHRSVYIAAEQSHLERDRRKTLAIASRLQEPVPTGIRASGFQKTRALTIWKIEYLVDFRESLSEVFWI
jgi:hypothetical protein